VTWGCDQIFVKKSVWQGQKLGGGIPRRKSDMSRDWKSDFWGVSEKCLLRLWCHRFVFCSFITPTV